MDLGNKLLELRKMKHLSQEEAAEKLGVSRQTISKWETNQSTPDFDKIMPICELYEISADELFKGEFKETKMIVDEKNYDEKKKKKALLISSAIIIYFISVVYIMIAIPVKRVNPIVASSIFLLIAGIATGLIVYASMVYRNKSLKKRINSIEKQICDILSVVFLIIYLLLSFITMAWHITWIIWIIYGLLKEIVKLIFMLKGCHYEE